MASIKVKVIKWGTVTYATSGCVKTIDCTDATVLGTYWFTPSSDTSGVFNGWKSIVDTGSVAKPSTDSIHVVKLRYRNDNVWIVVDDSDNAAVVIDKCNACCGDTAFDFSAAPIPAFALEQNICVNAAGNRVYAVNAPTAWAGGTGNPGVFACSVNGAPITPAPTDPQLASLTALVAYLNGLTAYFSSVTLAAEAPTGVRVITMTLASGMTSAGILIQ